MPESNEDRGQNTKHVGAKFDRKHDLANKRGMVRMAIRPYHLTRLIYIGKKKVTIKDSITHKFASKGLLKTIPRIIELLLKQLL